MEVIEWVKLAGGLGLAGYALYILGHALVEKNKARSSKSEQCIELTPKELSDIIARSVKVGVKEFVDPITKALENNTDALRAVEITLTSQNAKLEHFLHGNG